MSDIEHFISFLGATLDPNNSVRSKAEECLKAISSDVKATMLLQVLSSASDPQVMEIAAVHLRQLISKSVMKEPLSQQSIETLRTNLPQLCISQKDQGLRVKLVSALGSLISQAIDSNGNTSWPQSSQFAFQCLTSNEECIQHIGFRLIDDCPMVFSQFMGEIFPKLIEIFARSLNTDTSNPETRLLAAKSYSTLVIDMDDKERIVKLSELFEQFIACARDSFLREDITGFIQEIMAIIECRPYFLRPFTPMIVHLILEVLTNDAICLDVKYEGMECISMLAESVPKTLRKKCSNYFPHIVNVFLTFMSDVVDAEEWLSCSDEEDADETSLTAETSLDRFCCGIGGKTIFPIVSNEINKFLQSGSWKNKYAALMATSCTAEACVKRMKPYLKEIIEMVLPYINDQHPRVVYATINAIGQLAVDFMGHFHSKYHEIVFPTMIATAQNYKEIPKIQSRAVCCFINLIDGCPKKVLKKYESSMVNVLVSLLNDKTVNFNSPNSQIVLEEVLASLGKLSDAISTAFTAYYKFVMPTLIQFLKALSSLTHFKFYVLTFECISSVMLAVQYDTCCQDVDQVMQILQNFSVPQDHAKDNNEYYLKYFSITATFAALLGDRFKPMLPLVMPHLLDIINSSPNVKKKNGAFDGLTSDEKYELFGDPSFNSDALGDKHTAFEIVTEIASCLGSSFSDYVEPAFCAAVQNIKNTCNSVVREDACSLFTNLIACVEDKGKEYQVEMCKAILNELFINISAEIHPFMLSKFIETVDDCFTQCGPTILTPEIAPRLASSINHAVSIVVKAYTKYKELHLKKGNDLLLNNGEEDEDDELDDEAQEYDDILNSIECLLKTLLLSFGVNLVPFINSIFQTILLLLNSEFEIFMSWAMSMITDIVQFTKDNSFQYHEYVMPQILKALTHHDSTVSQAAFFCVGVIVEHGGKNYNSYIQKAVPIIVEAICSPNSRDEENSCATANAISTVGKICKFSPECVGDFNQAISTWITWLPVIDDEIESILSYFIELIKNKYDIVVGNDATKLKNVLITLGTMGVIADDPFVIHSYQMLEQLKTHIPDLFNFAYSSLANEDKENLEALTEKFNSVSHSEASKG